MPSIPRSETSHTRARTPARPGGLARMLVVAAALCALCAQFSTAARADTTTAAPRGTRWGLAVARMAVDPDRLQRSMGRPFASRGVYYPLCCFSYPDSDARALKRSGGLVYININSWRVTKSGAKVCYPWADVAAGKEDSLLSRWVKQLSAFDYGRTIITFHHEPSVTNNPAQPHCGTPGQYRAAYDHVFRYFRNHGIGYRFVWTMMASDFTQGRAWRYRPPLGDFRIVGVDGFNRRALQWKSAAQMFSAAEAYAVSVNKQLLIGEIGSEEDPNRPGRKAAWITAAAATFGSWDANLIAIEWTDCHAFRPTTSTSALNAWVKASKLPVFQ